MNIIRKNLKLKIFGQRIKIKRKISFKKLSDLIFNSWLKDTQYNIKREYIIEVFFKKGHSPRRHYHEFLSKYVHLGYNNKGLEKKQIEVVGYLHAQIYKTLYFEELINFLKKGIQKQKSAKEKNADVLYIY